MIYQGKVMHHFPWFCFGVLSGDIFPFAYIFVVEDVLRSFLCDISPHSTYLHHILSLSNSRPASLSYSCVLPVSYTLVQKLYDIPITDYSIMLYFFISSFWYSLSSDIFSNSSYFFCESKTLINLLISSVACCTPCFFPVLCLASYPVLCLASCPVLCLLLYHFYTVDLIPSDMTYTHASIGHFLWPQIPSSACPLQAYFPVPCHRNSLITTVVPAYAISITLGVQKNLMGSIIQPYVSILNTYILELIHTSVLLKEIKGTNKDNITYS